MDISFKISQIKRGFDVFRQICINCHSLKLFKLMDLLKLGYTHKQAALLVKKYRLIDYFKLPYKSAIQARRFNNGALPPDLSLVTKYRTFQWIYDLLTGYGNTLIRNESNLYQNKGLEQGWTAMRPPLAYGCIKSNFYAPHSIHQYSRDVIGFLDWVSEPWLTIRQRLTIPILSSLFITGLMLTNSLIKNNNKPSNNYIRKPQCLD
ncbi:cytochrome c1 [Candidatus Hodgkinia cicadicola]|uniref:Cytochrome c1 n=1 Tax=Candidatus Hodgkinia cicadicola TaxID=573658 RepID=A0ABX4MJH1_9HYPH|nr:Cytochrome c1 precursor [Candidatus Hodgkinia cicadicola]